MAENQEGLGTALSNLYRGIVSLITTGSWRVEEYADQARSAEMVLDRVDEAVEHDAQRTLDHVDEALTSFNLLNARAERLRKGAADWRAKAQRTAIEAGKVAQGTPERAKWEGLAKQALNEALKAEDLLKPLKEAIDQSRPDAKKALQLIEQVGMSKETALSQRDRLEISRATAEAKQNLATAFRNGGAMQSQKLLREATEKVDKLAAQAAADETIAEHLPQEPSQVEAQISRLSRQDRLNDEFAQLMANQTQSGKPA